MPSARRARVRKDTPRQSARDWTSGAHALAAIGTETAKVVAALLRREREFDLFTKLEDADHRRLAAAFAQGWTDGKAAQVIQQYADLSLKKVGTCDIATLSRWVLQHPDDAEAVVDCMSVIPPDGVSLIRRLSQVGSQKKVYLASWKLTQREIVLKRIIAPPQQWQEIFERESRAHPFSMAHPNIIETHPLTNVRGEKFLAEERLPVVLKDAWSAGGVQEAANLIYDIAKALRYIHGELKLVHGDVKPDNIGNKDGAYILLDFGICRPIAQFVRDVTATGSLRTRAPELFETDRYDDPPKVDVWAIAATAYKAVTGSFPFIDPGDKVPRISTPENRARFEEIVRARIRDEWDTRVNATALPEPLRLVLGPALARRPEDRVTAADLVGLCERHLAGFLRNCPGGSNLTPLQELRQLIDHLPRGQALKLMPVAAKQLLSDRLHAFRQMNGLEASETQAVEDILAGLG